MSCYRSGGCGPYEMTPCNECPYSKPPNKRYTKDFVTIVQCPSQGDFVQFKLQDGLLKCKVEQCNVGCKLMPDKDVQLEFAINCLRGVCAACKFLGTPEDQEPCSMCGETPGYGLWEWKFAADSPKTESLEKISE